MVTNTNTESQLENEKKSLFIGGEVLTQEMTGVVARGRKIILAFVFTIIYMILHIVIHYTYEPSIIANILLFNCFYGSMLLILWKLGR